MKLRLSQNPPTLKRWSPAWKTVFSDSMTLLKRIPVTLTLEVSSVEIMLADLLNIDDDTVIELDKLAGEPLDIKVNNILLGKAEVVVVNEKYGLRVLEFNTRDINDLAP